MASNEFNNFLDTTRSVSFFAFGFDSNNSQSNYRDEYVSIWSNLRMVDICPNWSEKETTSSLKLESVSIYQVIDLLGEGPIEGICDKYGNAFKFSADASKNENVFKGIYLNDVPIKDTDSNYLNYNRFYADIRLGTEDQPLLADFENNGLSFRSSYQTFNYNTQLPGLTENQLTQPFVGATQQLLYFKGASADGSTQENQLSRVGGGRSVNSFFWGNFVFTALEESSALRAMKSWERNQGVRFNHTISNDNVSAVQITMNTVLNISGVGGNGASGVNFVIKVSYKGDEVLVKSGGSLAYVFCGITGIATSAYERSYVLPLPPSIQGLDRQISIFRIDYDREPTEKSTFTQQLAVGSISEIINIPLSYPNSAIASSIFDARAFSQVPRRTYDCKHLKVKVPSNYDPETRSYSGDWDGTFNKNLLWTDNPCWIFYDLLTNKKHGLAKYGFKSSYTDKWNLYKISKYCDEYLQTGNSGIFQKVDFTISKDGTVVTVDDSSTSYGESGLLTRFPEGETVCLTDLVDSNSNNVKVSYKRIIFNPRYNSTNSTFTFTILQEPPVRTIFDNNPALEREYINEQTGLSAKQWLTRKWIENQNSSESYVSDYINGSPMGNSVISGKIITQFFNTSKILEPRFSCNISLDQFQPAINVLNDIAAIFRGITYWSNSYIFTSNDQERDAVLLFTNANVKNGTFSYTGSAKTARHTAALIRYNDEEDSFKAKAEYIEDAAGMREYGYLLKEVVALGVTSRSLAHRLGKWILYTNQTETDLIQFQAGPEASFLLPGDVIKVQDKLKTVKNYGGRVIDINYATRRITLDKPIKEGVVGQKITLITPNSTKTIREVNNLAKTRIAANFTDSNKATGITEDEIDEIRKPQIRQFTIDSLPENNIIKISEISDESFNTIKKGSLWSIQNLSADLNIKEVEYRIIYTKETSPNEYEVSGMMYNRTKFDATDLSESVESTQQSKSQKILITDLPAAFSSGSAEEEQIISSTLNSSYYDAYFTQEETPRDTALSVSFSSVANTNGVTSSNTGGYLVEVYKDGQKVRFALDGYDNTSFDVFLGDSNLYTHVHYEIYRYDNDYKLQDLNI